MKTISPDEFYWMSQSIGTSLTSNVSPKMMTLLVGYRARRSAPNCSLLKKWFFDENQ